MITKEVSTRTRAQIRTVKKIRILPADLSIENGELTPTLKVRRRVVAEHYASLLEDMYQES